MTPLVTIADLHLAHHNAHVQSICALWCARKIKGKCIDIPIKINALPYLKTHYCIISRYHEYSNTQRSKSGLQKVTYAFSHPVSNAKCTVPTFGFAKSQSLLSYTQTCRHKLTQSIQNRSPHTNVETPECTAEKKQIVQDVFSWVFLLFLTDKTAQGFNMFIQLLQLLYTGLHRPKLNLAFFILEIRTFHK